MTFKYSPRKDFYYRNRRLIHTWFLFLIGLAVLALFYLGCNRRPSALYEVLFKRPPAKSVTFYHSQDQYILDCCLWLHFKIDSADLNHLLRDGFTEGKLRFDQWDNLVPPEAKDWWHTESLGEGARYYTKERPRLRQGLYTNALKSEVYVVHYFD